MCKEHPTHNIKPALRAGDMAQLVKCLLGQHKGLSLSPSIHVRLGTDEAKTGGSLELAGQPV